MNISADSNRRNWQRGRRRAYLLRVAFAGTERQDTARSIARPSHDGGVAVGGRDCVCVTPYAGEIAVADIRSDRRPRLARRPPRGLGAEIERGGERGSGGNWIRVVRNGARHFRGAAAGCGPSGIGRIPAPSHGSCESVVVPPSHQCTSNIGIGRNGIGGALTTANCVDAGAGLISGIGSRGGSENIANDIVKAIKSHQYDSAEIACGIRSVVLLVPVPSVSEGRHEMMATVDDVAFQPRTLVPFHEYMGHTNGMRKGAGHAPVEDATAAVINIIYVKVVRFHAS